MTWQVGLLSDAGPQNEAAGDSVARVDVDPAEETWENTESTEERMLDEMEDVR